MLITIGITAYNEGELLRECWESVLAQADSRWEAIMVLDGNADALTRRVFDSLRHEKLRKIQSAVNVGPYGTRNTAIENARAEWYFHLDGDDLLPPNAIRDVLSAIETYPAADIVLGDYLFINGHETHVHEYRSFDHDNLWIGPTIPGPTPTRISVLRERGLYTGELSRGAADWDMIVGMAEMDVTCASTKSIIYHRRARSVGNVGNSRPYTEYFIAQALIRRHPVYFQSRTKVEACLSMAAERTAKNMYRRGNLIEAGKHADIAITLGRHSDMLRRISHDSKLPRVVWRMKIRLAEMPAAQKVYLWFRATKNRLTA